MSWGVRDVTVRIGGALALDRVTLDVEPGGISAVVGGDGAGKSTLLGVMTGRVAADAGTVRRPLPTAIGAMAEVPGVWSDLTVREHVEFTADVHRMAADEVDRVAGRLLQRAGLDGARDRLAGQLSGGMRQKLAVVLALLHGPDLLVLDEPTTGVDPVSRADLWRLVGHAAAEGTAVLLATSYLDEAERAGRVLVLSEGRPLLYGSPWELAGDRRLEDVVVERQLEVEREVVS